MKDDYHRARAEHAFILRSEGLKLREIGDRLGVGRQQADQLVFYFERRLRQATKKMKIYFPDSPAQTQRINLLVRQLEWEKVKARAKKALHAGTQSLV